MPLAQLGWYSYNRKCVDHLFVLGESSPNTHINEEHHPYEDVHPGPAGEGRVEDPGLVKVLLHPDNLGVFHFLEEEDCQDEEESEADLKDGWERGILKISQKARHYTSHCNMIFNSGYL